MERIIYRIVDNKTVEKLPVEPLDLAYYLDRAAVERPSGEVYVTIEGDWYYVQFTREERAGEVYVGWELVECERVE